MTNDDDDYDIAVIADITSLSRQLFTSPVSLVEFQFQPIPLQCTTHRRRPAFILSVSS